MPGPSDTSAASPFERVAACFATRHDFNRAINIDPDGGFIYFENPKVASSTTKATLNIAVAARAGRDLSYESMGQVHDRAYNPMLRPQDVGRAAFERLLADAGVLRFTYLRDPLSRFISAYRSKLVPHNPRALQIPGNMKISERFHDFIGSSTATPISMEDFGALCASDPAVRDFDPHWRLQREQVAFDAVDYGFIGRQESFGESFPRLLERLFPGGNVVPHDSRVGFRAKTSERNAGSTISAALQRNIETAYAPDYEMLEEVGRRFG